MSHPNTLTVLFVDDETSVLSALQRMCAKESFAVETCESPKEALARLQSGQYAVLVSDQRMPEMGGAELLAECKRVSPDTVRILLTGHADLGPAIQAINEGAIYRFLTKPWKDDELRATLQQAVEQYDLVLGSRRLHALTQQHNMELRELNLKISEQTTDLKETFKSTIRVLARIVDMHSPEIGSRAIRVTEMSLAVCRKLALTEQEILHITLAATLHDVGNVMVPAHILEKPEHYLKSSDLELLRSHATHGADLIRQIPHLQEEATIIRHHHEHFNGTGYPDGLHGDDIPLGSRIIAAADMFDKLLCEKGGKRGCSTSDIMQFMENKYAPLLDPIVLSALKSILSPALYAAHH